jgi:hypothetical protein
VARAPLQRIDGSFEQSYRGGGMASVTLDYDYDVDHEVAALDVARSVP